MKTSEKSQQFTESVIREMTRLAQKHGCINLAQGFPDFESPAEVVQAAVASLEAGDNQYSITWGSKNLRDAVAASWQRFYGMPVDPETEVTVCCGSTEAMLSSILAVIDPGEEIIIFEPHYENYGPDTILTGASPLFVSLVLEDEGWSIDWPALEKAFERRPAAIIINTPNNPTGKVFTEAELTRIAELCQEADALCITDEIYDHMTFDGRGHIPPATIPGMRERTISINALSKTFAVTGWRVGWAVAPPELTTAIRKVHDFVTVGAPHPLQEAGAQALSLPDEYFSTLAPFYQERRDACEHMVARAGFMPVRPEGAYYMMANISNFGWDDDVAFARWMAEDIGVAVVPGSSFYKDGSLGTQWVRFCFSKRFETLDAAARRLKRLAGHRRML